MGNRHHRDYVFIHYDYVFLTEEKSMKVFLETLLKRLCPNVSFLVVSHEGKGDLKKSIHSKLNLYKKCLTTKVVVLIDQDSNPDCIKLKNEIVSLCNETGASNFFVRIVCRELESWYFGDLGSVDAALGTKLSKHKGKEKYRSPDSLVNPKEILRKETDQKGQLLIAEKIGKIMDANSVKSNTSKSFQVFRQTIGLL
jgi:hypothetical protein